MGGSKLLFFTSPHSLNLPPSPYLPFPITQMMFRKRHLMNSGGSEKQQLRYFCLHQSSNFVIYTKNMISEDRCLIFIGNLLPRCHFSKSILEKNIQKCNCNPESHVKTSKYPKFVNIWPASPTWVGLNDHLNI